MPNYRALSCMTLDGDEAAIAGALSEDHFLRQCAKWYPKDDGYSRDPALVAFETGDHAPRGMSEKPAKPAASEPVKRGGWVNHDAKAWWKTEAPAGARWAMAIGWVDGPCPVGCVASFGPWPEDGGRYEIIAYSTDETCPEWIGEAAQ